jgi:hypothetical protein
VLFSASTLELSAAGVTRWLHSLLCFAWHPSFPQHQNFAFQATLQRLVRRHTHILTMSLRSFTNILFVRRLPCIWVIVLHSELRKLPKRHARPPAQDSDSLLCSRKVRLQLRLGTAPLMLSSEAGTFHMLRFCIAMLPPVLASVASCTPQNQGTNTKSPFTDATLTCKQGAV